MLRGNAHRLLSCLRSHASGILTVVRRTSACLVVAALAIADTVLSAGQITHLRPPDVKYVPTPQPVVDAMLRLARPKAAEEIAEELIQLARA